MTATFGGLGENSNGAIITGYAGSVQFQLMMIVMTDLFGVIVNSFAL